VPALAGPAGYVYIVAFDAVGTGLCLPEIFKRQGLFLLHADMLEAHMDTGKQMLG